MAGRIGRPPKPKVKIKELLTYLDGLPDDSQVKKLLTPDKMLHIRRYVEELIYMDYCLKKLKADIEENGEIELYENGNQKTRRQNPAYTAYLETVKAYNQLFRQVRGIIDGIELIGW